MERQNNYSSDLIEENYITRSNLGLLRHGSKNYRRLTLENTLVCQEELERAREAIKSKDRDELWHRAEIVSEKSILAGAYRISPLIKDVIMASEADQKEKILDQIQDELKKFMLCLDKVMV